MRSLTPTLLLIALSSSALAANWPAWRGADGSGATPEKSLPLRWPATENARWKIPLPDRGDSTPVVWGDQKASR